jgi:hypothetical protein
MSTKMEDLKLEGFEVWVEKGLCGLRKNVVVGLKENLRKEEV